MQRKHIVAGVDHVQNLAHERDPIGAVLELIWNGLDADATQVRVDFERNDAEGIETVTVTDNGSGIPPATVESSFTRIGDSWKRAARSSPDGRPLHGQAGQGRLRAFALGNEVSWVTTAKDIDGKTITTLIRASSAAPDEFEHSDPQEADDKPTGTVFHASGKTNLNRLDSDNALERLLVALAPYLLAYPDVELLYDGHRVRPEDDMGSDETVDVSWAHGDTTHVARLRIIEWTLSRTRSLHLCDAAGVPVDQVAERLPAPDFQYSAYVLWDQMPSHANEWMLARLEQEPSIIGALLTAIRHSLEEHFEAKRAERRREFVEGLKQRKTYPYAGEPSTEEEKVERASFDVVVTAIRDHIPNRADKQKLTLGLLKDTLQRNPEQLGTLLDQFIGLSAEEKENLERLLTRTSLARIVRASSSVTDRLDFLAALKFILFDRDAQALVKERDHLHKMLERELWLFGEEFHMMMSERGLTNALRQHLTLLGRDPKQAHSVRLVDGGQGRLDLMLSAKTKDPDRIRHLVIELKAPDVTASSTQTDQIKKYARAVVDDPQFADMRSEWDFMLIVGDLDKDAQRDVTQEGRERGILDQSSIDPTSPVRYRVWVKRWNEVLDTAERRLDFYQESLRHDPSIEDVKRYLLTHHDDVLPEGLFGEGDETESAQLA